MTSQRSETGGENNKNSLLIINSFQGKSMFPTLLEGDCIGIELFENPKPLCEISHGQVILLRLGHEWVIHRKINLMGDFSKGDWSLYYDEMSYAWGAVKTLHNKNADFLFNNKIIAHLSRRVTQDTRPLKRKILKLLLLVYSQYLRLRLWTL